MLEQDLAELLALANLSQAELSRRLGLDRATINRWLRGALPIPAAHRTELVAEVMLAAEIFVAFCDWAISTGRLDPDVQQWVQRIPRIGELMDQCRYALLEAPGDGATASIAAAIDALAGFRDMSPADLRKPANAARFEELASYLARYAGLLRRLGPMPEGYSEEEAHGRD